MQSNTLSNYSDRWRLGVGIASWLLIALNSYELPGFWRGFCERSIPAVLIGLTILTTAGCGSRLLVWFRGPVTSRRLEHFCVSSAIGWAVLSVVLCALAMMREFESALLNPIAFVFSLFFGLGFDGRRSGWDVCGEVPWLQWARIFRRDVWIRLAGLLTLVIVMTTILWAWGPVWDYDAEMYHLPNAADLLRHRGLVVDLDNPLANLPGQAYLWFALGLAANCEAYAALLVCWAAIITSLLAACLAGRWLGTHAAIWTVPVFWSGLIVQAVASTPRVEPIYSMLFLTAVTLLIEAWQRGRLDWGTVLMGGICLGTAGAIKYQGLYGWLVLGIWWGAMWCASRHWRTTRTLVRLVALFAIGFAVLGPWWWKNYQAFGTPVYPMFDRQRIDLDSLRHANPHGPHHRSHQWYSLLIDTWDLFAKPDTFSGPPNQWPHYTFLLIPLMIIVWPRPTSGRIVNSTQISNPVNRSQILALLLFLAGGYFALSLRLTHELRHLFGMFALASILCAYVIAEFHVRWGLRVFFPGMAVLMMTLVVLHPSRLTRLPNYAAYVCGMNSAQQLRAQILSSGFDQAVNWCNAHTPPDAVILFCWESRRYRLHRNVITDPGGSTWMTLFRNRPTAADVSRYLHAQGVDYVLVNEASLDFNTNRSGLIPRQVRDDFWNQRQRLVPSVLEPMFGTKPNSRKAVMVYRVRPSKRISDAKK